MPTYCDVTEEAAVLNDLLGTFILTAYTEEGVFDDLLGSVHGSITLETAVLDDFVTDGRISTLIEAAVLNDLVGSHTIGINVITERAVLNDALGSKIKDVVTDAAVLNDALGTVIRTIMLEAAGVHSSIAGAQTLKSITLETAILDDLVRDSPKNVTLETAVLDDAQLGRILATNITLEAATIHGILSGGSVQHALILESAVLNDFVNSINAGKDAVLEVGYLDDAVFDVGPPGYAPSSVAAAWTIPTDTFAMSRYSNYAFNSLADVNGYPVGIGAAGAYLLAGTTDAGTRITWQVVGDLTDALDSPQGKRSDPHLRRPVHGYFAYAGGGFTFTIGETGMGAEAQHSYYLPIRNKGMQPAKVEIGRGIRARFYRVTLQSRSGAPIDFNDGSLTFDILQRRV